MTDGWSHRILATAFRDFYTCLSDMGAEIEADPWHYTKRAGESAEDRAAARQKAVVRVRTVLRDFLKEQARELTRSLGPEGLDQMDEAQYVMASLADEVLVNMEWEGREAWSQELLETLMFGSHVAGEQVLERAEALLNEGDEADPDLAWIYLSAISLGFLGKYRGARDTGSLQSLRRRLLSFVTRGRTTLADDIDPLFTQPTENTLISTENLRLPPVRRWATILVLMLLTYVVISHVVWVDVSEGIRDVTAEVARTTQGAQGAGR